MRECIHKRVEGREGKMELTQGLPSLPKSRFRFRTLLTVCLLSYASIYCNANLAGDASCPERCRSVVACIALWALELKEEQGLLVATDFAKEFGAAHNLQELGERHIEIAISRVGHTTGTCPSLSALHAEHL